MFHSREGFYFNREDDGSVRIRVAVGSRDGNPYDDSTLREVTIAPNEWASVIASVSARGEKVSADYHRALDFHQTTFVPSPAHDPHRASPDNPERKTNERTS